MCISFMVVFFFKSSTLYELRISDLSSDVCSSDLSPLRSLISAVNGGGTTRHSSTSPTLPTANQSRALTNRRNNERNIEMAWPNPSSGPLYRPCPSSLTGVLMLRSFLMLAAFFGFTGVALGAFAAHGLKNRQSADYLAIFHNGVPYPLVHTLTIGRGAVRKRFSRSV